MEAFYDYRKCTMLYVDDEEMALKYFTRAFENRFPILTAANAADGTGFWKKIARDRPSDHRSTNARGKRSAVLIEPGSCILGRYVF